MLVLLGNQHTRIPETMWLTTGALVQPTLKRPTGKQRIDIADGTHNRQAATISQQSQIISMLWKGLEGSLGRALDEDEVRGRDTFSSSTQKFWRSWAHQILSGDCAQWSGVRYWTVHTWGQIASWCKFMQLYRLQEFDFFKLQLHWSTAADNLIWPSSCTLQ